MLDQLDQMQVTAPIYIHSSVAVSSYAIGPIDPSHLIAMHARCSNGEECPLLVPKALPLWILNHPEFHDGYERNYFTEEGEEDEEWRKTIPHMVNLIYSKLLGVGFENPATNEVEPDLGAWEIGYLLRDFTRLAETDRIRALTGIAHLCFLLSFLPPEQPVSWPPDSLVRARWQHNEAVKAYRGRVRGYREQGQSFEQAQRLALAKQEGDQEEFASAPDRVVCAGVEQHGRSCLIQMGLAQFAQLADPQPVNPLAALLVHPEFQRGLAFAQATFLNEYEPAPLTEEEMIEEVEEWLSRDAFELDKTVRQVRGLSVHTYLYNLGLTVGTINQGLTFQASFHQLDGEGAPC